MADQPELCSVCEEYFAEFFCRKCDRKICQECDEVIHMIPEKTVHQRIALKPPDPPPAVPSSQIAGLAAADPGGMQYGGSELGGDLTYGTNVNVKSAHSFHRELESTIHKQQVSRAGLNGLLTGIPPCCLLCWLERGGTGSNIPHCSMHRRVVRVESTLESL
jgi:hypothetical protein